MFSNFHILLFYLVEEEDAPYLDVTQFIQETGC